jgi:glucokinase
VTRILSDALGSPAHLQNDANACALAEWRWGAGRGSRNMIFLTFGTGMGAGLILDGRLYAGTNGMAGEAGHIRLEADGPVGYGKSGSFEGFCSGGGIARLASAAAERMLAQGPGPLFCRSAADLGGITAETVASAAHRGDPAALEVFETAGKSLGRGLAVLVDLFNPQRIVIGSIYVRQQDLLEPSMLAELEKEALPQALSVCRVLPAGLGENLGNLASLSVALDRLDADRNPAG